MSARIFIILLSIIARIRASFEDHLEKVQMAKPLPEEVADVYDKERYQQFLAYTADSNRIAHLEKWLSFILETIIIISPVFALIESMAGQNPYLICLLSVGLFWIVTIVPDVWFDYYSTFVIDEKYGLNKQTKKDFAKDEVIEQVLQILLLLGVMLLFTFVGTHMEGWTNSFNIGYGKAFLITAGIAAAFFIFAVIAAVASLIAMRKQYTFTPIPENDLRSKIMALQEGSKKKVKHISIYDESKKSVSKNAFLLKFLWYREFGIADNFINENAENELLAVLSHEVGHLKHKKNLLNFIQYLFAVIFLVIVALLIANPAPVLYLSAWVRTSFGISMTNYYLLTLVLTEIYSLVSFWVGWFGNYRSRQEEREADMEAVKNGYGEELIATFKRMSNDELVNVNPHPVLEFINMDHPGMYTRIKYTPRYASADQ